uniref:Putative procollagen c-endopeptidase enhancer n=1 Tax=Ixodes ricinus TaxID=34613 RepID=A0A0K8R967_IXORI
MRLALTLLLLFPAVYATWYNDHVPFKCGGNVKISKIFLCDGKRQCPNDTTQSFCADDEDPEICVATRYLPPKELVLRTQSENNLTVFISWSFEDSAITKPGVELTSDSDDSENVHLAGYLLSGTSDHHNFKKTFTAQVNEYRVSGLKPWTQYEIVLRPYYTSDGSVQPFYKVGKAAYTIYRSEATAPTAPAYARVLSVEDKTISMKVGDPLSWNGEPGGYWVRWETLDSLPERRGQAYFGIPETRSLGNQYMKISMDLVPGRHYVLHTSVQNIAHQNKSLRGPEVSISTVVPCTDPVSVTAIATGPHDVTVTWRSESFVEYFEISALALDASQTDKKEQSVPDDDEVVASNNTFLNPQDVLINVTAEHDPAQVYNITIHKLIPSSNVSVCVKSCAMDKCTSGIVTPIFTQPDYPPFFEVFNVTMTAFEVRVMPSRYTQYQVRYCNEDSVCKTIFTPGSVSIVDLMPGTTYTVDVREGLRDANGQVILGPAAQTHVSTRKDDSCVYNITAPFGQIFSPNYPNIYPNSASCSWLIKTNPDILISLVFNDFELEKDNKCISDYVSVYDGNDTNAPIFGTYCGNTAPAPILSSSDQIYMVFKSDSEVQGKGFSATYSELYKKDPVARRGSEQRIYSHVEYGNQLYDDNIDRDWVIRAPAGHVRLRFSAFDIEAHDSCEYDYVKVFDGSDKSARPLKTFCGDQIPGLITSSSDSLLLRFHTDGSVTKNGFVALYSAVVS